MGIGINTSPPSRPPATRPGRALLAGREAGAGAAPGEVRNPLPQTPPVRADKVQEARKLVNDQKYPTDEVLDRIAAFLASRLRKKAQRMRRERD